MDNSATEEIDILAELNKSTEPLNSDKVDAKIDELLKGYTQPEYTAEEEEEDKDKFEEAEVIGENNKEKKETPAEEKASNLRSANRWVKAFNTLLKVALPGMYMKKIMEPGDMEALREYKKKKDLNKKYNLEEAVTQDDRLYQALQRFETLETRIKEIPLTKDEMADIAEPLAECIEKYKWMKAGPEASLFMSVGIIMLPRLEPILPNFSSWLDNMFKSKQA